MNNKSEQLELMKSSCSAPYPPPAQCSPYTTVWKGVVRCILVHLCLLFSKHCRCIGATYSKAARRLSTLRDLSAGIYTRTPISPPCRRMTYSWRRRNISPTSRGFCSSIQQHNTLIAVGGLSNVRKRWTAVWIINVQSRCPFKTLISHNGTTSVGLAVTSAVTEIFLRRQAKFIKRPLYHWLWIPLEIILYRRSKMTIFLPFQQPWHACFWSRTTNTLYYHLLRI